MIECRGRNGWFELRQVRVDRLDSIKEGHVAISIGSRSPWYNVAPIYLRGPRHEILELLEDLQRRVLE